MGQTIGFELNGEARRVEAAGDESLLHVLRNRLGLTGTKYGCGEGDCGACTVLLNGMPAKACTRRIGSCDGLAITTIEGLGSDDRLHPVQEAFLREQALQCGYCTPGMIVAAAALLDRTTEPSAEEIVRHLDGHLCRCGLYRRILAAVRSAAQARRGSRDREDGR